MASTTLSISSWETRKRGISWREISHEENRREKRGIDQCKMKVFGVIKANLENIKTKFCMKFKISKKMSIKNA